MAAIANDDPSVPRLIIGDLNTTDSCNKPPQYQCDYDSNPFNIPRSGNLTDLWRQMHGMNQHPGYAWSFFVIKKVDALLFERSDYAWGDHALTSSVKSVDLFATEYEYIPKWDIYSSDHYGSVVTLQFD